ncbi:MAG TPA: FtsQ-type POTRA domain-containing protein [Edaphobacter sp.]|nr:FtsQ-type POTRA domain-containing protein [Edaphobacter sp.]
MLEAPEQEYAREPMVPRRTSATPKRKLRRDFSEDFADDFPEDDELPGGRRQRGVRVRFRWGMPTSRWGKLALALMVAALAAVALGAAILVKRAVMHDPHFMIQSASSIEIQGNAHLTRDELVNIFGQDVERNIFYVSLAQRQAELQQLPWVEHATVMRLLPNRLRVSIVERTPVAFVRQGNQIGLVDRNGVLLDMPAHGQGDAHYSFPVLTGIRASDPASTRAARMQIFEQFISDLDSTGEHISQKLSEVDLSNPEDVKALIPENGKDILVHFGDTDYLKRYQRFEEHLAEWRTQYPTLSSVDMRYERQVVLEMQPGTAGAATASTTQGTGVSSGAGLNAAAMSGTTTAPAKPVAKAPAKAPLHTTSHSATHTPAKAHARKTPTSKAKVKVRAKVHKPVTRAHHSAGSSRYHSSQVVHP